MGENRMKELNGEEKLAKIMEEFAIDMHVLDEPLAENRIKFYVACYILSREEAFTTGVPSDEITAGLRRLSKYIPDLKVCFDELDAQGKEIDYDDPA